jgi:hypothetical protein
MKHSNCCEGCIKHKLVYVVVISGNSQFLKGVHSVYDNLDDAIKFIYSKSFTKYYGIVYDFTIEHRILNDDSYKPYKITYDIIPKNFNVTINEEIWNKVIKDLPDKTYLNSLLN